MKKKNRPILITGSHRSGTTWIGKMLALAPNTAYIHEPFNIGIKINVIDIEFPYWFFFISTKNQKKFQQSINRLLNFSYPLRTNLKKATTLKDFLKIAANSCLFFYYKKCSYTPILKDPIAFFSTEWLYKTFNFRVLISIRHPAAFCSSLKIKNWQFNFNNFLNQPLLMNSLLNEYNEEIKEFAKTKKSIIEQGILLWNCIHSTIKIYKKKYPDWIFVKHEHLSENPIPEFKKIYNRLNLDFTSKVQLGIEESSGPHNPKEQDPKNEFKRNSKANIKNWKNRLTKDEIDLIKNKTFSIAKEFYSESEW